DAGDDAEPRLLGRGGPGWGAARVPVPGPWRDDPRRPSGGPGTAGVRRRDGRYLQGIGRPGVGGDRPGLVGRAPQGVRGADGLTRCCRKKPTVLARTTSP